MSEEMHSNVREGGGTILILAIKADVQEPTLSLGVCGRFPNVYWGRFTLADYFPNWSHISCASTDAST